MEKKKEACLRNIVIILCAIAAIGFTVIGIAIVLLQPVNVQQVEPELELGDIVEIACENSDIFEQKHIVLEIDNSVVLLENGRFFHTMWLEQTNLTREEFVDFLMANGENISIMLTRKRVLSLQPGELVVFTEHAAALLSSVNLNDTCKAYSVEEVNRDGVIKLAEKGWYDYSWLRLAA